MLDVRNVRQVMLWLVGTAACCIAVVHTVKAATTISTLETNRWAIGMAFDGSALYLNDASAADPTGGSVFDFSNHPAKMVKSTLSDKMTKELEAVASPVISLDDTASGGKYSRYFFGLLDHRSKLAKGFFPGTFLAVNVAAQREIALTWYHFERGNEQLDLFYNEFKWGLDQWTIEFQSPYQHEHVSYPGAAPDEPTSRNFDGLANFAIVMRSPIYQYVSKNGNFDYSLVPGLEIDPPSGSAVSTGTTLSPRLMQAIALSDHFSVMTSVGLSFLTGSHQGGQKNLTWDTVLGYNIYHKDLPLPGIADITPVFEIVGSDPVSGVDVGRQSITTLFGVEINPEPQWGYLTPYIGVGAGPAITSTARRGGDWVLSAYVAFALP